MTEALAVHEAGKPAKKWTLHLYPNGVRATPSEGGGDVHLLRAEAAGAWRLVEFPLTGAAVAMKRPRKVSWQLGDADFDRLARWLGYVPALKMALGNRLGWTVAIGLVFLVASLPLPGDPAAGVEPVPFNAVTAVLGAALVVQGIVSRFVAHRAFFALDALWFLALAVDTAAAVFVGGRSMGWLVIVVFQLMAIASGLRQFRRYDRGRPIWRDAPRAAHAAAAS